MDEREVIQALDGVGLGDDDPEAAHQIADGLLISFVLRHHPEVAAAYARCAGRQSDWWYA